MGRCIVKHRLLSRLYETHLGGTVLGITLDAFWFSASQQLWFQQQLEGGTDKSVMMISKETLIVLAMSVTGILCGEYRFPDCTSSCVGLVNKKYPSCQGLCNGYVICLNNVLTEATCERNQQSGQLLVFDYTKQACVLESVYCPPVQTGTCVGNCTGKPDGNYQSCITCYEYVSCSGGNLITDNRQCPATLKWDDSVKTCERTSTTCPPPSK